MIAYTIKPVVLGAAAARAAGVACFAAMITGMGYAFLGGLHPKRLAIRLVAMLMYRRALAASQLVIFQNEDDRRDFRRLRLLAADKPSLVVNGSGVDLDHFAPRPAPAEISFLMIARFLRDKGIREYGAAAARLKAEFPKVGFRLAGWLDKSPDSIGRAELDSILAGGIEDLGRLADVRPAIARSSVYVLPSYREGTPRTVLEAMAIGRAVITTDAPGCRGTVVDGENGFLVPVADPDALYRAMRRFVERTGAGSVDGREVAAPRPRKVRRGQSQCGDPGGSGIVSVPVSRRRPGSSFASVTGPGLRRGAARPRAAPARAAAAPAAPPRRGWTGPARAGGCSSPAGGGRAAARRRSPGTRPRR